MKLRTIAIGASFFLLPLTAGLLSVTPAHAENPDCTITISDMNQITAAATQGLASELAARKALLTRVIACARTDAESLQANLQQTSVDDSAKILRTQFSDRLGDAMNYYDIELTKVKDAGISGTQIVAGEVLSWRKANYVPLSGQVANFILWSGNQNVVGLAGDRLNQTEKFVSFLETATGNTDLEGSLVNARVFVQAANDENQAAKNALAQFLPPDQSLTLIMQSLQSLSDAYGKFFEISTIAQGLLPTKANQ